MPRSGISSCGFGISLKRQPDGDLGARMLGGIRAGRPDTGDRHRLSRAHRRAFARGGRRAGRRRRRLDPGRRRRLCADRRARGASAAFFRHCLGHRDGAWQKRARALPRSTSRPSNFPPYGTSTPKPTSRAASGCFRSWRFNYCNRISTSPHTISSAAPMRTARSGSLSTTTAITAPNSTLVSRKVATMAIGASVIAHSTMP